MLSNLAALFRTAQLTAHAAYNPTNGPTFLADHNDLAELYAAYESTYDHLIERMIGEGEIPDLISIYNKAVDGFCAIVPSPEGFGLMQKLEIEIRAEIDAIQSIVSFGTQNLLGRLADESLDRSYKLGQRLKSKTT